MRVCEPGQQLDDPCNVKNDTAGCVATMGIVFRDGFSYTDLTTGESRTFQVDLPPPRTTTKPGATATGNPVTGSGSGTTTGSNRSAASGLTVAITPALLLLGFNLVL